MAFFSHFLPAVPISFPRASLRILFALLVAGWLGIHGLVDFWLFHSDDEVWPAIGLYLIVEFLVLSGFMAAELPKAPQKGEEAVAQLSVAMRRMALRIGDFRRVINDPAIVAITDGQGRITFANHKFCAISGYQREEWQGNTHQILDSGKHPADFFQNIWKIKLFGKVWSGEIENCAKNGIPYYSGGPRPGEYLRLCSEMRIQEQPILIINQS
jgi:PAS domain-containing protein